VRRRLRLTRALVAAAALLAAAGADAQAKAQAAGRIRGTIVAVDAATLVVRTPEGRDAKMTLAKDVSVGVATRARYEDLRAGDFIGSTTRRRGNDDVALEVHFLPASIPLGRGAWDLAPGTQMTRAKVVSALVGKHGRQLIVQSPAGQQRIVVPDDAPIVRFVPGTRADLVRGEFVFVAARGGRDGVVAERIQVGKNGVRPSH
jgi:hypothetical protein